MDMDFRKYIMKIWIWKCERVRFFWKLLNYILLIYLINTQYCSLQDDTSFSLNFKLKNNINSLIQINV